jgi:Isochorismatase family
LPLASTRSLHNCSTIRFDLELILRSRGVHTVVIAGISTPVCCDTTAREAHARDFRVLFLRDATASTGDDADRFQRATLDVLDELFADVVDTDDVLEVEPIVKTTFGPRVGYGNLSSWTTPRRREGPRRPRARLADQRQGVRPLRRRDAAG